MKGKCDMMPKGMIKKMNGDMGTEYRGKKGKKGAKMDGMNGGKGKAKVAVIIAVAKPKKMPGKKK